MLGLESDPVPLAPEDHDPEKRRDYDSEIMRRRDYDPGTMKPRDYDSEFRGIMKRRYGLCCVGIMIQGL